MDDAGKSLAGDFDAQCRQTFRNIEKTLAEAGAKLADLVTMTVFLIDARHTTRMTELRTEIFGKDFPASAAITVAGFAQPEMMIEIQCRGGCLIRLMAFRSRSKSGDRIRSIGVVRK